MTNADYGMGRIFTPDPDDHKYLIPRGLVPTTVTKKTWGIKKPVLNQGRTGTCVAHAWTNFLRCAPIQSVKGIDTPYDLYRKVVLYDEYPSNDSESNAPDSGLQSGSSVRAGAKVLTDQGRMAQYLWAFDLDTAANYVLTNGPVVLGTNWYHGLFDVGNGGFARIGSADSIAGGHAYFWRGVDVKRGVARCQNSWGAGWGLGGEFLLSFEDLSRLIKEDGEACTAVEQKLIHV